MTVALKVHDPTQDFVQLALSHVYQHFSFLCPLIEKSASHWLISCENIAEPDWSLRIAMLVRGSSGGMQVQWLHRTLGDESVEISNTVFNKN